MLLSGDTASTVPASADIRRHPVGGGIHNHQLERITQIDISAVIADRHGVWYVGQTHGSAERCCCKVTGTRYWDWVLAIYSCVLLVPGVVIVIGFDVTGFPFPTGFPFSAVLQYC